MGKANTIIESGLKDFNKEEVNRIMNTSRRSILCGLWMLLFCIDAVVLSAQSTTSQDPNCFNIHVHLNDKLLEDPKVVILRTRENESTVSLEGGCFKVPSAFLKEKELDVLFTVPWSKVHLSAIPIGFFSFSWDVDLQDKKFGREVPLPKHACARETCTVIFHGGEPERQLSQTPCRTPLSPKQGRGGPPPKG